MSIAISTPKFSENDRLEYNKYRSEFIHILINKKLEIHFQPIISLEDGSIYGYEALSRGPKASYFYSPAALFPFAEKMGYLYPLEKVAREMAFEHFRSVVSNQNLFINISAPVIHEPSFTPGHTISLLNQFNLKPNNIVFEITERSAITDFPAFKKVIKHYRDQGFKIAVDDAGAGYSSLQTIIELEPDYIKIDRSLISGIEQNDMKSSIVDAFVNFAKRANIRILAEGIETEEELVKIKELGMDFGQGYFIGRPHREIKSIDENVIQSLKVNNRKKRTLYANLDDEIVVFKDGKELTRDYIKNLL